MKRLLLILLLLPCFCFGQNLVPNPSFEVVDTCPDNGGQIHFSPPWNSPTQWGSSDYYNPCGTLGYTSPNTIFGPEPAYAGSSYAGIVTFVISFPNGREYIQVPLTDSLLAAERYCVRFYVSLADSAQRSASNIGAYFSDTVIFIPFSDTILPFTPQINNDPTTNPLTNKVGWTMVQDSFVAAGGEKYMIIGNFNNDASTVTTNMAGAPWTTYSYYFIDDISVQLCEPSSIPHEPSIDFFTLYPNPTTGLFTVQGGTSEIEVYDMVGCKVLATTKKEIDLSSYAKGIYLIRVGEAVRKIVLH